MRTPLVLLALLILTLIGCTAAPPSPWVVSLDPPDPADAAAEAAFLHPVTPDAIKEQSLGKVFDYLGETAGVNWIVNWRELEATGITPNTQVTLSLPKPLTVGEVLRVLGTSGQLGTSAIAWYVRHGTIIITTQEGAARHTETRIYNVGDLIRRGAAWVNPPDPQIEWGRGTTSGGTPRQVPERALGGEALVQAIQAAITPSTWVDNGGTCSIRAVGPCIIITAPADLHAQVVRLIEALRKAM